MAVIGLGVVGRRMIEQVALHRGWRIASAYDADPAVRAVLVTDTVLQLLDTNARTLASLRGAPLPPGWAPKPAVEAVLEATGFSDKRAIRCSVDDFLTLLAAFNAAGLHFSC
jgi:homoserine dehydrogenase